MCCMYTVYSGMQEWVIQIPSIPFLVSALFPSLHLKHFRIKFLLLVIIHIDIFQLIAFIRGLASLASINTNNFAVETKKTKKNYLCIISTSFISNSLISAKINTHK